MNDLYRLVDANLNRIAEGVRVVEDTARFHLGEGKLCAELRDIRHAVRELATCIEDSCIGARAAASDVGLEVSRQTRADERHSLPALVAANFKRIQEGLRVLEETLKVLGRYDLSKEYELLRFRTYSLEVGFLSRLRPSRAERIFATDLYGITAAELSLGRGNIRVAAEMLEAGITILQYREKNKDFKERYRECQELRRLTREAGAAFIVNDHPDLALMVEADGVHIGQEDYPIETVRSLVGEEMLIGVSTHAPEQASEATSRGADYLGVGPIFATSTKGRVVEPVGMEYLDYAVAHVTLPWVALGGIKESHVAGLRCRGARVLAMASEIVSAPDIQSKVRDLRAAMKKDEVAAL